MAGAVASVRAGQKKDTKRIVSTTRAAIGKDDANSWLAFTGRDALKGAVADYIERRGGRLTTVDARS